MTRKDCLHTALFVGLCMLFSCISSYSSPLPNREQDSGRKASLEEKVDRYINSLPVPFTGTILLGASDKILLNKGYGLADKSFDVPNRAETKFLIGSITKLFTAVLVLQMAEKGLIDIDATIDTYFPYFPEKNGSRITVRHLLEHKSGIPHHFIAIPKYFEMHDKYFHTPLEFMKHFWDIDLLHEPGERMTYSSPGYYVLGVLLETLSGKSYSELLEEKILAPLGMKDSHVHNNLTIHKNMATGYQKGLEGYALAGTEEESTRLGAGNILSTAGDLFLFQRILNFEDDNILSTEYKKMLLTPHSDNFSMAGIVMSIPYNDGKDKLTIVRAGGSSYGFQALLDRFIEDDACMIALSNIQSDKISLFDIFEKLGDFLVEELEIDLGQAQGADAKAPDDVSPIDPQEAAGWKGFYRLGSGSIVGIYGEDGRLFRRVLSEQFGNIGEAIMPRELLHRGRGVFDVDGLRGLQYRFIKDTAETGYTLALFSNGERQDEGKKTALPAAFELSGYEGKYFSVELQKTYRFLVKDGRLFTDEFLGEKDVSFVPLEKDVFGFDKGFLLFHRYESGAIRDFKLENENLDLLFGSMFIRK